MDLEELRLEQAAFEPYRQDNQSDYRDLEKLRKEFVKLFSTERVRNLTIGEYVEGKRVGGEINENTFCYWVEWRTKDLGMVVGATAYKFGLFCDVRTQRYRFTKKFRNENEALEFLKGEIVKLIQFGRDKNLEEIKNVELSPMFKGKILFLYYPDKFLNIFSNDHLNWFLDKFGKLDKTTRDLDEVDKREILIQIKNADDVMRHWTTYEFSDFLYNRIGRPPKKLQTPEALREYIDFEEDYPDLSRISPTFIQLEINPAELTPERRGPTVSHRVIDFEKENKRHKRLGEHGEAIVLEMEKEFLNNSNRPDLAKKVKLISKENTSAGYDILYYDLDGKEKYIEVKSTNSSPSGIANFLITINEYKRARELGNYYIYIVFNTKSNSPKVWAIKNPISLEGKGLFLSPISFRVIINTKSV